MDFTQLRDSVINRIQQLSGVQRVLLGAGAVLIVATLVAIVLLTGDREYAPLFSQLSPQDAGDIIARLDEEGIPYKISDSGSTISVPKDQVHRLRLQLAGEGLPSGGVVGMELLDRFQFGATEFERRMNFLRALQGELTRTIQQIDAVEDARVHIVMPEERLFVSQREPATAAVLVRLKPGRKLEQEQVAAIIHLVSGSVEGLLPEDVTVVDAAGTILSAGIDLSGESFGSASWQQLEVQQRFQEQLQSSLQTLLEQVFGPGNVVARVNAQLNFDQTIIERDLFEPVEADEGLLRSVQELEEEFEGGAAIGAAFPGTDANIPIPTWPGTGLQDARYRRTERTGNYELNEIRERLVIAPGTVERLSVSVVVNQQLTPQQIEAIQATVQAAVGFDAERNDQITVIGMPFDTTISDRLAAALAAEEEAQRQAEQRRMYVTAVALALFLIVAIILLVIARRRAAQRREQLLLEEQLRQIQLQEQKAALEAAAAARESRQSQKDVETLVREHPEQVASIVRAWMAEE